MGTAIKWVIGIIVIAGIAWLVWWSGWLKSMTPTTQPAAGQTSVATTTPVAEAQPTNGMSASNDTSDAALNQDAAAIDTQMSAYNTDSANVNSSLNDQPVSQSY